MRHEVVSTEYMSWLTGPEGGYTIAYEMPGGLWCALRPLMFHWTMHIGVIGDRTGYDDRYCYADVGRARWGIEDWRERGFEGEPRFWRKHPTTDRCRNDDGDPESETIGWALR